MRTFFIIGCVVALLIGATALYLILTTPQSAPALHFPLSAHQTALLAHVPTDAEAYALIPAPVVLLAKLVLNPITSEAVTLWTDQHALPPASMLGRADAVIWKRGRTTSYAVRFDPVRAVIVRVWTLFASVDAQWSGRTLIVNGGNVPGRAAPQELAATTDLAEGDALVVQRQDSRGAYPPIGRPAVTSVRVTTTEIELASRAAVRGQPTSEVPAGAPVSLPRSALLSAAFREPPRILGDVDRLLGTDLDALVGAGGTVSVYRVDTGTFLPRPFLAVAVPASDGARATLARYASAIDTVGQKIERNGELVVSFDRNSAGTYIEDARAPLPWPGNQWSVRADPARLIPVLRKLGDNPALRFAAPRIHRGARDLRRWMGPLERAASIEAVSSAGSGHQELRVRVSSK